MTSIDYAAIAEMATRGLSTGVRSVETPCGPVTAYANKLRDVFGLDVWLTVVASDVPYLKRDEVLRTLKNEGYRGAFLFLS